MNKQEQLRVEAATERRIAVGIIAGELKRARYALEPGRATDHTFYNVASEIARRLEVVYRPTGCVPDVELSVEEFEEAVAAAGRALGL